MQAREDFEPASDADERWMREALGAARGAALRGEVPVGACVVGAGGELLALAGNRTRADCDPTAHAEVLALREAARRSGNYRLTGAVESVFRVCDASSLNHRMELTAGVLGDECRALMQEFFRARRRMMNGE